MLRAILLVALVPGLAVAQSRPETAAAEGAGAIAHAGQVRMHTLLEKTIFKVDVLTVDVWLGRAESERIASLGVELDDRRELGDSIAEVAIHSRDALVRIDFVRDVSLDQFLGGVDENLGLVPRAGIIPYADYEEISANLPRWFAFLDERGIHKGDRIEYRIHGDTLRTRYVAAGGELLLDQTDVGSAARLSVLGSYFVRKSEFRKGLLESLTG